MPNAVETGFAGPAKSVARQMVFEGLAPVGSFMTLPGANRWCVQALEEQGVINDDTQQVWVERDRAIARELDSLANSNTKVFAKALEEYDEGDSFDLINADTMSSFGPRQAVAVQNLVGNINPGGTLVLWATGWPRNGDQYRFREWLQSRLDSDLCWLRDEVADGVVDAIHRAGFEDGDLYDGESIKTSLVATLALARCAMARCDYRVGVMGAYRDGTPMLVVRFNNITARDNKPNMLPSATELLVEYNNIFNKPSDQEEAIQKMIAEKSAGSHHAELIADGDTPRWVLLSPTGKTLKSSKSIEGLASFYK